MTPADPVAPLVRREVKARMASAQAVADALASLDPRAAAAALRRHRTDRARARLDQLVRRAEARRLAASTHDPASARTAETARLRAGMDALRRRIDR